ncbi:conserved protein of unknown function [Ralstonia solanacearum CMR15]|uniref:Uncharacterized protein n=1 Tax=Ralstonia solanacearum TaxID=305 RepID=A0A0S4XF83_RALSL|nr:conserved protein of unknown function [Ralstonia solanacearum CMR15]CUV16279.1 conserved protein of unknown function [Ralstonia solanacearum]CUV24692.1 conserved protein of unknown function [Ralstonia solanacearum]CUV30971.1 conserved protein of unknown function [Ralstonia solanacearum]CUV37117.1 conserved protein of unknown function [Ralstonia solanacearum]
MSLHLDSAKATVAAAVLEWLASYGASH